MNSKNCSVENCTGHSIARGYCDKHYRRLLHNGTTEENPLSRAHGLSHLPEHSIWRDMKKRCNNPNANQYHDYGGRGIKVCPEWINNFPQFLKDVGTRPTPRHTIDRINNDLGYSPGNCKWSTYREQAINRRKRSTNTSGITGVNWHKQNKKWVACISIEGKSKSIACTTDFFLACCARLSAENKYYSHI